MESRKKIDLLAIVGPTASGKSGLAMKIAKLCPAEIITADSRTIYKGMDIGTAKPTQSDQHTIAHWGLDLVGPDISYSAQDFQNYANQKIKQIRTKGKLPILVGGTGLYVDSVLYNFKFTKSASSDRSKLEKMEIPQLQQIITERGLPQPANWQNPRHLIRTIERGGQVGTRDNLRAGAVIIGLLPDDIELRRSIDWRAEQIFKAGVIEETKTLINKYGSADIIKNGGIVYKICIQLIDGQIDTKTALDLFKKADWQYARRQRTWFKRNSDIEWFKDSETAFLHLKRRLNT